MKKRIDKTERGRYSKIQGSN